ncbi:MAG: NAD(P)/FAD-dependent oxidoreductase [bacterium]|nr:NAD(P)/FAD-dependent oxidoreductase [bacterium]
MNVVSTTTFQASDESLTDLENRVRKDLAFLCYPPANWVPTTRHPGADQVHDVVVIGAGMCGLVASFALLGAGISNLRLFDCSLQGREGPWLTYARMETLRSPKHLLGPAYGMASLTFRAWFEAQFGAAAWDVLDKIPRLMWMDYLCWYRCVLNLPVENEVEVSHILPMDGLLKLELSGAGAREAFVLTRKVVLATGRDGTGHPNIPAFVAHLPRQYWAHSSDDIDFSALRGKRVVVVGVGASSVDNAAEALEAGAAEVRHLIRRQEMPRINKFMGIGSFGFSAGFPVLSDAWRWRFMHYSWLTQTPAPRLSTLRVSRHTNAFFHFDAGIEKVTQAGDEMVIETVRGVRFQADYMILGTGFTVAPMARPELAEYADKMLLWQDRYTPPPELAHAELGRFPYLAQDFAFQERHPGAAPCLNNIHCFNFGATVSLGKLSGDIPAVSRGASWLARALAAHFYTQDIEQHWQKLLDYDKPELQGDEWVATEV